MSNQLKTHTGFILAWYVLRWFILPKGNEVSMEWVLNSHGNQIALLSLVYLPYAMYAIKPQKKLLFILASIGLFVANLYFLYIVINDYIKLPDQVNFGAIILDIAILHYYFVVLKLCYMTNSNKNINSDIILSYV